MMLMLMILMSGFPLSYYTVWGVLLLQIVKRFRGWVFSFLRVNFRKLVQKRYARNLKIEIVDFNLS